MVTALSTAWAPVLSGLVASFVTLLGAFGLEACRRRHQSRADQRSELSASVRQLLTESLLLVLLGGSLRLTMQIRSGLVEGMDIAAKTRRPLDPLELHDRMVAAIRPLIDAQSTIWTLGDDDLVLLTNTLINKCTDLVGEATAAGEGRGRGATALLGMRWTSVQDAALEDLVRRVGEARDRLAQAARESADLAPVRLIGPDADDDSP